MNAVKIGGQVLHVFGGAVFTLVVGLPLQIYVVRSLGAQQFGAYSLVEGALATIANLLALGIAPTAVRFIPEHLARGEGGHVRTLVAFATAVLLTIGVIGAVVTVLFSHEVIAWWGINDGVQSLIAVMVLTIPIGLLTFLYLQILRGFQQIVGMVFINSVVILTAKAVLSLLFIHYGFGTLGYAWAVVLSSGFGLTLMAIIVMRLLWRLDKTGTTVTPPFWKWIRYASFLTANGWISGGFQYFDRFMVGALIGAEGVATLVVARQLTSLPTTFINMFVTVTGPIYAASRGQQLHSVFQLAQDWCMRLASPLIYFLILFGGALLHWYGRDFAQNGTVLLILLLLAPLSNLIFGPIGYMLVMTGCESNALQVTAISAVITVLSYLALIPLFGIAGIGIAAVFVAILGNFLTLRIAQRKLHHVWWTERHKGWLLPALLSLGCLLVLRAALGWNDNISIFWLGAALAASYAGALAGNFFHGFHADDRELFAAVSAKVTQWGSAVYGDGIFSGPGPSTAGTKNDRRTGAIRITRPTEEIHTVIPFNKMIVVASHPRSGTHLMIDLLRRQFPSCEPERPQFFLEPYWNLDEVLCTSGAAADRKLARMASVSRPVLKTHRLPDFFAGCQYTLEVVPERASLTEQIMQRSKRIYVYRSLPDTMKSLYVMTYPFGGPPFSAFIREMRGPWSRVGWWAAHLSEWMQTEGTLLVRYEDVMRDPDSAVRQLAEFIGEEAIMRLPLLPPLPSSANLQRVRRLLGLRRESTALMSYGDPATDTRVSTEDLEFMREEVMRINSRLPYPQRAEFEGAQG